MRIDEGDVALKSVMGTICSFILLFVTASYAYFKLNVLLQRKDTNITTGTLDLYFDDKDVFDNSQGMNMAIAFTTYDNS